MIRLQQQTLMKNSDFDLNGIKKLYENVKSDENVTIDNMESSCLDELCLLVDDFKNDLREKSRTARLWLQYMDYAEICHLFIHACRTANRIQHLTAANKTLNLFAATGHRISQNLLECIFKWWWIWDKEYSSLYNRFNEECLFVVRRSEWYWPGTWPYLSKE